MQTISLYGGKLHNVRKTRPQITALMDADGHAADRRVASLDSSRLMVQAIDRLKVFGCCGHVAH